VGSAFSLRRSSIKRSFIVAKLNAFDAESCKWSHQYLRHRVEHWADALMKNC
jgi:hypothetical protein